jgi:hypothetical protein
MGIDTCNILGETITHTILIVMILPEMVRISLVIESVITSSTPGIHTVYFWLGF